MREIELLAPAKNLECGKAAIDHGADAVYIGAYRFGARANAGNSIDDITNLCKYAHQYKAKIYVTLNTIVYEDEIPYMRKLIRELCDAGVDAILVQDMAVAQMIKECGDRGPAIHASTQTDNRNAKKVQWLKEQGFSRVVLARELNISQVSDIYRQIKEQDIRGPHGDLIRIEMFCHGALCMAVSGKCYMSLHNANRSANRGECVQICRRSYTATDNETGNQLEIDNKYIMSPKDLKTIRFINRLMEAGVRVFKIEGRARGPEYVHTVVGCYKEAVRSVLEGTFTEDRKDQWDKRLATVFNRGFWDGYYQGQTLGEWNKHYGSNATEKKVYIGKGVRFFSKLGVAEFSVEAAEFRPGDRLLITGPTTGVMYVTPEEIHGDNGAVDVAMKGTRISIAVPDKVRQSDKLFKLVKNEDNN